MANKRKAGKSPKAVLSDPKGSHPGQDIATQGAGQTKRRRGRRPYKIEVVLANDLPPNDHHPLAGLTQSQRERERRHALGQVLANIALRKASQSVGSPAQNVRSEAGNTAGRSGCQRPAQNDA